MPTKGFVGETFQNLQAVKVQRKKLVPRKVQDIYKKYLKKYGKLNEVEKYEQYLKDYVVPRNVQIQYRNLKENI